MKRLLVVCVLLVASCGGETIPPPRVDTTAMEEPVARLIGTRYQALETAPDSGAAWGQYAMALHAHLFIEPAILCYERAHALDPASFDYPYLLAFARGQRGMELELTLDYLEKARAIAPDYPPLYVAKGNLLAAAGRVAEAREAFETALSKAPDYDQAHSNLGEMLILLGDPQGARKHLEVALRASPDDRSVNAALARALALTGEPDRARDLAKRTPELGIRLSDGDSIIDGMRKLDRSAEGCFRRAKQLATGGRWEEVVASLRITLGERDDDYAVHSRMGHALLMLGRTGEARSHLERTLELNPDHVIARLRLAKAHKAAGRLDAAKEEVTKVLSVVPTLGEALTLRGVLHLQDNELVAADQMFRRAQSSPQGVTGDAYMLWGVALAQAARLPEAIEALGAFALAQPRRADGRYALALAYEQNGQFEEAIREYEAAIGLDPNHAFAVRGSALMQGR